MSKNRNFVDFESFQSLNVRQITQILKQYKSSEKKKEKKKDEQVTFATVPKGSWCCLLLFVCCKFCVGMGKTSRSIVEKIEKERGVSVIEDEGDDDVVDEKLLRKLEEQDTANMTLLVADSLSLNLNELEQYIKKI